MSDKEYEEAAQHSENTWEGKWREGETSKTLSDLENDARWASHIINLLRGMGVLEKTSLLREDLKITDQIGWQGRKMSLHISVFWIK